MKKKVLLVSHEMTYTGAPHSLLLISDILQRNGFEVEVWTLKEGEFSKEFENKGIKVSVIDFPKDEAICKENLSGFDVVLANTIFCSEFAFFFQEFVKTILYIREAQNIPSLIRENSLNPEWLIHVKNIVCVSEYAKEFIEKTYGIRGIIVIHNYVEDEYMGACVDTDEIVDLVVSGTLEERKGQDVALEAFRSLPEELRKKARLHFIGQSPTWSEQYVKYLNLEVHENVIYHGEIKERTELIEFYQKMDVFLVPSIDESCSLVALEAAMLGKPLIVTENTGAKYIVSSDCIVPTGDADILSKKMAECIRHLEGWMEYGKLNRESYLLHASRQVYEKQLLEYVTDIMEFQKEEAEKQNKIKVSIVVPIYNVEQYLVQCLESLLIQSLKEIEIICVNDGSTDNSLLLISEYEKKDSRIRVISGENYGYGHAMNIGMDVAQGEFLGIVEPDDYVDSQMFEILYQRAIATNADIVKADFFRFYGEGDEQRNIYNTVARIPDNYNRLINPREEKECFRFIMNTWAGIYRRDFIEQNHIRHNETPGASYQDNGFWFQGFCRAKRITFVNKPLYYNRRDNPNSSVNSKEKIYCANEEYAYIREFLKENPELEAEFLYQFSMKKYHTYIFTLNRVGWQYKKEYLNRFAEEFRYAKENRELCKAVFTPQEWTNLHWIMNNPDEYYEKVVRHEIEISIVIPFYNAEKYIYQCLKSLESQLFTRYEVICIDDGSTDSSREIVNKFVCRDKRYQLYVQQNQGAGAARNKGAKLAQGEYIMFLDADDYFAPEMLLHAWTKIRETEADICVMNSWQHDNETGGIVPCKYTLRCEEYPEYRPFRVDQMQRNPFRYFMGWAWDKLYLKRFIVNNELEFQEQRTSNDMYFTYMSLFKADRITTLDERLIYQRRNIKDSLSKTREKSWECFYIALIAMKQELVNMGVYDRYRVFFVNYALHSCLWNLKTLSEEIAELLRIRIRDEWGKSLGLDDMKRKEAEYLGEYEDYLLITEKGSEGLKVVRRKYEEEQENLAKDINNKEAVSCVPVDNEDNEELHYQACIQRMKNWKIVKFMRRGFRCLFRIRLKLRKKKFYKILAGIIRMPGKIKERRGMIK